MISRIDRPLCRGEDHAAGRGGEQGPCLHPYWYVYVMSFHHTVGIISFTGFQSKQLIVEAGLGLGDVDQYPTIDVTLDGADE